MWHDVINSVLFRFQCCFRHLTKCILKVSSSTKVNHHKGIITCRNQMFQCVFKNHNKSQWLQTAPQVIRVRDVFIGCMKQFTPTSKIAVSDETIYAHVKKSSISYFSKILIQRKTIHYNFAPYISLRSVRNISHEIIFTSAFMGVIVSTMALIKSE